MNLTGLINTWFWTQTWGSFTYSVLPQPGSFRSILLLSKHHTCSGCAHYILCVCVCTCACTQCSMHIANIKTTDICYHVSLAIQLI